VNTFPGFSQKHQVAAYRFSKEFCANPRNISINSMRETALSFFQKNFVNSEDFGVKKLLIQIKLTEEFKKYCIAGGP
jgi:hypothetical protein